MIRWRGRTSRYCRSDLQRPTDNNILMGIALRPLAHFICHPKAGQAWFGEAVSRFFTLGLWSVALFGLLSLLMLRRSLVRPDRHRVLIAFVIGPILLPVAVALEQRFREPSCPSPNAAVRQFLARSLALQFVCLSVVVGSRAWNRRRQRELSP